MKSYLHNTLLIFFTVGAFFILGCSKENNAASSNTNTDIVKQSISDATSKGVKTLTLQPGPEEGIDTWLTWQQDDDVLPNTNWDTVNITAAYAWTNRGAPIRGRSLIKFAGLSSLPASSLVISARLYMYGVPSSARLTSGNSVYPGTPYTADNSMTVERITQDWSESTATWNHQPTATLDDRVVIPTSTSQWNYDANVDVTLLVNKMVAQPSKNFGFMFRMSRENEYKNMMFSSSDYSDSTRRPKLVVVYK